MRSFAVVSATALIVYHSNLCLSTTFFKRFWHSPTANGEGGIWTLAPLLTTCTLSRGVPSTSWVLLQIVDSDNLYNDRRHECLAERVGFEPTRPCGQTVFKTASLWPLRYPCTRAGDGNRTHVSSLEGWCSTIELHPHVYIWSRAAILINGVLRNAQNRNRTSDTRIFSPLLYQLSYLGPRLNPSCNLYLMTALRHNNRSLHKFWSNVKWLIEKFLNFCNYSSISYKCFG